MGALSKILRSVQDGGLAFRCPGCNSMHMVKVGAGSGPRWQWNEDPERPTFSPSILVSYNGADAGKDGAPPSVCHSFVTDGRIAFLGDCTHALAGQTVPIPPHTPEAPCDS